ncbi:MAG TPA: HEAT repeat domain-containing protein [Polyangiaceae bacterium]|jgi:HEAT repeat protein
MRTSVWKGTTAAAVGLALLFAFRPVLGRGAPAPAPAGTTEATTVAAPPSTAPDAVPAGVSPTAARVARARAARGTEDACSALAAVGRVGDGAAVSALVEAFQTRAHADVRECALTALGYVPGDAATSALVGATHDPLPSLRAAAFTALAGRDDAFSRSTVIAAAQSSDPSARLDALVALAGERVPGASTLVEQALDAAASPAQRERLLAALGEASDPGSVPTLARFAESPVEDVRSAVLGAAAKIGGPAWAILGAALARNQDDAILAVRALGAVDTDDSRAALIRATDDPRAPVAAEALSALASFDGEDVRAAVVLHVGSKDAATATAAARWLALRGDGEGVASLVDAAQRFDESSAGDALTALGGLDTDAAHAAILALASRPGIAREHALRELAGSAGGAEQARALAIRMMRDEGGGVASTGLRVLSDDESPEATRAIAELARSKGPLASEAVQALGQRHDEASLLALVETARTVGENDQREEALSALAGSKDPRATRALLDATQDTALRGPALASLARIGGPDAERALASAAGSADPADRAAVARALMNETPPALLPHLETLARDPDESVSDAAFAGLRSSAPASAAAVASEGLHAPDAEARVAAAGRAAELDAEVARPLLVEALRDADPSVVAKAAEGLAATGGADAQQALLDVVTASGSSDEARRAAAQALETMGGAAARDHADTLAPWLAPEEDSSEAEDETP